MWPWTRRRKAPRRGRLKERNHIALPGTREPPSWLLAELREIDPTVDLHYTGHGYWLLGAVKPNRERREIAQKIKGQRSRSTRSYSRWLLPELALEGFGLIGYWHIQGEPDGRIVNDFRRTDHAYRQGAEPDWGAMEMLKGPDTEKVMQEIEDRAKHDGGYFFRGRKSFLVKRTA